MGLIVLGVLGAGVYFACKSIKNKKQRRRALLAGVSAPAAMTTYRNHPPAYQERHQTWCTGTCGGQCIAAVQYTPPGTPEHHRGREDYFSSTQNDNDEKVSFRDEKKAAFA